MNQQDMSTVMGRLDTSSLMESSLLSLLNRLPGGASRLMRGGLHERYEAGEAIYEAERHGDEVFLLIKGQIQLERWIKGASAPSARGPLHSGLLFGEEAILGSGRRRETATASAPTEVVVMNRSEVQQALRRAGLESELHQARDAWRHHIALAALRESPVLRMLPPADLEHLLRQAKLRRVDQGQRVYKEGDDPTQVFFIGDGIVKVGRHIGQAEHIRSYLTTGDVFGDVEVLDQGPRRVEVTALGPLILLEVAASAFLRVQAKHPALAAEIKRLRDSGQDRAKGGKVDLLKLAPRMDVAQSLLVIDLNQCVRCGNCAWSCNAVHGASRLVRRGERVQLSAPEAMPAPFLIPNSCQHCTDAVCMGGCPTGAIKRDLAGEVFVDEKGCIGCGDCAKRCPWDNISMMTLPKGDGPGVKAVKCDNCRGHKVSACSHNCPTGALRRVKPQDEFKEVRALLGAGHEAAAPRPGQLRVMRVWWGIAAILAGAIGYGLAHPAPLRGGSTAGLAYGALALGLLVSAALLSARKRGIRWVMALERGESQNTGGDLSKDPRPATISLETWVKLHVALGSTGLVFAFLHGGVGPWSPIAAALMCLFIGTGLTGAVGSIIYRAIPRILTAIEAQPLMVEDIASRRLDLAATAKELMLGRPPAFHSLSSEIQRTLSHPNWLWRIPRRQLNIQALVRLIKGTYRADITHLKGAHREAMDQLIDQLAEARHLEAQALLHWMLQAWLPPHILLALGLGAILLVHLAQVILY